jgi:sarcosine oxidase
MLRERADVVVVGAGVIGLSAALALRARGLDVLVCEQSHPGAGQSGGNGRTFRHLHATQELIDFAVEARVAWREWESTFGVDLLSNRGALHIGARMEESRQTLADAGVACDSIDDADVGLRLASGRRWKSSALLEVNGGLINSDAVMASLVGALQPSLRTAQVLAVSSSRDAAVVSTTEGDIACARVLVCAGTQTDSLAAAAGLSVPVNKALHARLTLSGPPDDSPTGLAFVDNSGEFGVPVYGGFVKDTDLVIGLNGVGSDLALPQVNSYDSAADVRAQVEVLRAYAEAVFPDFEPSALQRCVTTAIEGEIGDAFGLWVAGTAAFFLGNNVFKFAPNLGRLLAHRVIEERLDLFFERDPEVR